MFCPQCGAEYRPGFDTCADCGVPLVHERPEASEPEPGSVAMVTVLESSDTSEILMVRSLLEGAGIHCLARGERLQNLFGLGQWGTGFNLITGPVQLQVESAREREARELLAELASAEPESDRETDPSEAEGEEPLEP